MVKLTCKSKDLSTKLFRDYPLAIEKAEQLLNDVNCNGLLDDRIYMDRDKYGKYFKLDLDFTLFKVNIRYSLYTDTHRVTMTGNNQLDVDSIKNRDFTYTELVEKIKQINTIA